MPIALILTILKANWKILAVVVAVSAYSLLVYNAGKANVKAEWDAAIVQLEKEANERSVKLEATLAEEGQEPRKSLPKIGRN